MTEFQAAMDDLELAPRDAAQRCPFRSTGSITGFSHCCLYVVIIPLWGFGMGCVFKRSLCLVSLGVLCFACGGCASPGPATPSFAAMPGWGKSYEAFQRDDQYCQSSAQQAIGYQSPGQAANQAAVGTAAVGTRLAQRVRPRTQQDHLPLGNALRFRISEKLGVVSPMRVNTIWQFLTLTPGSWYT
jgi:hypothetical protein